MPTHHLIIKGQVQGVFYRATAKEVAKKTDITGWIKNTKDGSVEALISGDEHSVQEFVAWCKKGPPTAVVTEVIVTNEPETEFRNFQIVK
ncbi:MAG: acylphosphatase [Chitinophagaceae bacterium]